MSCFPTGVAVVTTASLDGHPLGLTCSSVLSVTLTPPTLLVSLRSSSPTLDAIRKRGCFAVNLLSAQGVAAARIFSSATSSRFSQVTWRQSPIMQLPWLVEHAFASADCRLSETYSIGDHTLTVGQVEAICQSPGQPLVYGHRRYSAFSAQHIPPVIFPEPAPGLE
jgi:flavin reductase (DIM6/NTAB) family NADH-FMN oxidoreductase RutF